MDEAAAPKTFPGTKIVDANGNPSPEALRELQYLIMRAKEGDTAVVPRLREFLASLPLLVDHYGDVARQAEAGWAALVSGHDLYYREALLAKVKTLRAELSGPSPSPVERLVVERIVAEWLKVSYFDSIEAQAIAAGESPRLTLYRAKRQQQAHVSYMSALGALTTLRRLQPQPAVATERTIEVDAVVNEPDGHGVDSRPEQNEHDVNGHVAKNGVVLPPALQARLSGLFDHADDGDRAGSGRLPVAASN